MNAGDASEGPAFARPVTKSVAAGEASFNDSVIMWDRPLKPNGELAQVDATLRVRTGKSERFGVRRVGGGRV